MYIENTNFIKNSAYKDGGSIKFTNTEPILINSIFINNTALYGNDMASLPLRIKLTIYDENFTEIKLFNEKELLPLINCVSGEFLKYTIIAEIIDYKNLTVTSLDKNQYI